MTTIYEDQVRFTNTVRWPGKLRVVPLDGAIALGPDDVYGTVTFSNSSSGGPVTITRAELPSSPPGHR